MIGPSLRRFTSCILLSGIVLLRAVFAADVPAPIPPDNADVAAYVALPDLKRLLTTVEGVAKQVLPPNQFQDGMVVAQLGQLMGDPTLATLGNKPIMFLVFKVPEFNPAAPPPLAAFVPVNESPVLTQLQEVMKADPGTRFVYEDGVLIISTTDELLAKAKKAKALYTKITDARIQGDARVYINLASLVETFGAPLKAELTTARDRALADIQQKPPPPDLGFTGERAAQVVKLFFKVVNGLLSQAEAVQFDLQVKPDAIQFEQILTAKTGTLMADYLSGNPPPADARLQSFLNKGFEMVYSHVDPKAGADFVRKAIAAISADPEIAPLAETDLVKTIAASMDADGGESIFSLGASAEGGLEITGAGLVRDENASRAASEKMIAFVTNEPIFKKLMTESKVSLSFLPNARQRAGVSIERLSIQFNPPNVPPEQLAMIKKIIPQPEIAMSKGFFVMSSTPAVLDTMLDKIANGDFSPSPVTMKSIAAFGKDKNFYLDYDVMGYMKFVMSMVPDAQVGAMMNNFKSNAPLLMAGAANGGRAQMQVQIPLAPLVEAVKFYMMMQGGGPPVAPPKPAEDDKKQF